MVGWAKRLGTSEGGFGRPSAFDRDVASDSLTFSLLRMVICFCLLGLMTTEDCAPLLNECYLPTVYLGNVIGIIGGALYCYTCFPACCCFLASF